MLAVRRKATGSDVYVVDFIEFDKDSINRARDEFIRFTEDGVILTPSFEDNEWIVTNQVHTFSLKFGFSEVAFRTEITKENRNMGTYTDFVEALKAFVIFKLNDYVLVTIREFLGFMTRVVKTTSFFTPQKAKNWLTGRVKPIQQVKDMFIDFLEFYPLKDTEEFIEELQLDQLSINENTETGKDTNRRKLAEFQSYFYFDKLLDEFWEFSASDNEKLYYYPLYLFWKITNILPLRVTEFSLIPRDCLDEDNYVFTVRRSGLKGRTRKTSVQHDLENDYILRHYPISNDIAEMIIDYKQRTEQYEPCRFLLSLDAFYAASAIKYNSTIPVHLRQKKSLTKTINQSRLNRCLTRFYKEILQDRLNLKILYKEDSRYNEDKPKVSSEDEPLGPKEIMKIQLGDTRHFSLINMVLSGVSPILIKDFAGHENVNQSYHYFGHIDKFVKCMSYYKFQEIRNNVINYEEVNFNREITLNNIQLHLNRKNQGFKEVDEGKCFSLKFLENDITDCIEHPTTGILGDCFNCDFFVSHSKEYREMLKNHRADLEKKMNEDGIFLLKVLRNYKDTFRDEEFMTRTLLNIQQKAHEYHKTEEKLNQIEGFK